MVGIVSSYMFVMSGLLLYIYLDSRYPAFLDRPQVKKKSPEPLCIQIRSDNYIPNQSYHHSTSYLHTLQIISLYKSTILNHFSTISTMSIRLKDSYE